MLKSILLRISGLICLIICIYGCKKKSNYVVIKSIVKEVNINVDTSYFEIKLDSLTSSYYKIFSVNKMGIFCGYNPKNRSLDIISLNTKSIISHTSLAKSGPEMIKNVQRIIFLNNDSLLIFMQKKLSLININGRLLRTIVINSYNNNDESDFFHNNYFTYNELSTDFSYNEQLKNLYFSNVNPRLSAGNNTYYEDPCIAEISINDSPNPKTLLNVKYSELYKINFYGFLDYPQFILTHDNNYIIYNFPVEPNIYVYSIKNGNTITKGGIPINNTSQIIADSLNWSDYSNSDLELKHFLTNTYYYNILEDANKKLYYRFHRNGILKESKSKPVGKSFLTVFDKNFNILGCIRLGGKSYLFNNSFIYNSIIYIPSVKTKGYLTFKTIKVQLPNENK